MGKWIQADKKTLLAWFSEAPVCLSDPTYLMCEQDGDVRIMLALYGKMVGMATGTLAMSMAGLDITGANVSERSSGGYLGERDLLTLA